MDGVCLCGSVRWRFAGVPASATVCNCTACRRYGVIWAYDWEGEGIVVTGPARAFRRPEGGSLEFVFCGTCGCVVCWRAREADPDGRRRIAVNLRLADPDAVADIPIDRFDGLHSFADLAPDGRRVRDYWF